MKGRILFCNFRIVLASRLSRATAACVPMGPPLFERLKVVFPSKSVPWSGFRRRIAATDRESIAVSPSPKLSASKATPAHFAMQESGSTRSNLLFRQPVQKPSHLKFRGRSNGHDYYTQSD